jgi:Arc/MetJ-type ribon-helix-helix transcriptional regulator
MGLRKPQVNVSVEEETKERWEEAVEEDDRFSTMSDLVRVSVEREISSDNENGGKESGVGGKEFAELLERVETLENAIQGMGSDFQELKGIIQNQTPSNQNLKSEVFATLPDGDMASPLTPEEVASKIGGPVGTEEVGNVLEELAIETG